MNLIDLRSTLPQTGNWPYRRARTTHAVIHHSATSPSATPEVLAHYHVHTRIPASSRTPRICYTYAVDAQGNAFLCNDPERLTWHAGCAALHGPSCPDNANNYSVGVCLIGDFSRTPPPSAQLAATRNLLRYLTMLYGPLEVLGHGEAHGAQTRCPGDTWTAWYKEVPPTMPSKLTFHIQNPHGAYTPWIRHHIEHANVPFYKIMAPHVLGRHDPFPGRQAIGRLHFGTGEPDKELMWQGAQGARTYVEWCKSYWDDAPWVWLWEGPNERETGNPNDPNDLDPMRRLTEFDCEFVRLAHQQGRRAGVGQFSTGTPAGPEANPYPTIDARWRIFAPACRDADAVVVHEYGMETLEHIDWNRYHVGAYKRLTAILRAEGLRVPPVFVTEFGIDRGGNPDRDGWRYRLNGNEAEYMRQLAMRDAEYVADPDVWLVTPFTWAPHGWWSFELIESMSWRIAEHIRAQGAFRPEGGVQMEEMRAHKIRINVDAGLFKAIVARNQIPGSHEFYPGSVPHMWGFDVARARWYLWQWGPQGAQIVHEEAAIR